ncbi:hypothetical protein GNY06_05555 [Elizabethkingia argentiflava]|uniref:Uncharacterized protein n=1 Tax=Elizabethkingia argenteiflava TaxID=2681556 RepID=A0A845PRG0_9FLAO|nr:hypothetical protein [Elizabethkingia argenteiflava]NAW50859.1 hypothetical protein [Elizabethkingia argenteiflava]
MIDPIWSLMLLMNIGWDIELQLFSFISGTDLEDKIERSVYNRRKRKLFMVLQTE